MSDPAKRVMWPSQSLDDAMLDRIRGKSEAARCLSIAIHGIHPDVAAIVHDELGRYKVSGPMSIAFDLSPNTGQVAVILRTVDRDNPGKRIEFSRSENIATWIRFRAGMECSSAGISDHYAVEIRRAVQDFLYRLARDAYLHELGEYLVGKQPWLYDAADRLIDANALRGCLIRGETVSIRYRAESPVWAETADHAAITIHRRPHNGSRVTVELMYAGGKSSDIAQVVGLYQAVAAIAAVIEAVLA